MKKILFLFILLASHSQAQNSAGEQNVLFIGNSLTYYSDMPQKLQEMLKETHPHMNIEQSTFPGMSLAGHLNQVITSRTENVVNTRMKVPGEVTETEARLCERQWDIIILQTGGVEFLIPEARHLSVNGAINRIKELAGQGDSRFILFGTWVTEGEYPREFCYPGIRIDPSLEPGSKYCSPTITAEAQSLELLNNGFAATALETGVERTDHGSLYFLAGKELPDLDLLQDSMHPSETGAFLNALVFYKILTGEKAIGLQYTAALDPSLADALKEFADEKYR